jgi:secreted PhoX family phosphatase
MKRVVPATLELFAEPNNGNIVDNADNVTVAPWGDLVICEDGSGEQFIVGITPQGKFYKLARHASSEVAGATFSPDGSTLFFNVQKPGITFAVTGPWKTRVA